MIGNEHNVMYPLNLLEKEGGGGVGFPVNFLIVIHCYVNTPTDAQLDILTLLPMLVATSIALLQKSIACRKRRKAMK